MRSVVFVCVLRAKRGAFLPLTPESASQNPESVSENHVLSGANGMETPVNIPSAKEPFLKRQQTNLLTYLLLVVILLIAAFFRFYGRDFDQGTHQHPDERFIAGETGALSWP